MNTKKCIVLDLDNTLWGGIVGEDGLDGIKLSLTSPGASFIAFQQALLDLYNRGIVLTINSRNNFEDAIKVIRSHPNMILKEHHFAAMRINWNDKTDNIIDLAKELNIGLDSMVFFDDDSTNRASVRAMLPEVETPELPTNPANYTRFLISLPYFKSITITDEDKMRGNLYVTERLRKEAEKSFVDKNKFLKDLDLELQIFIDDPSSVTRLAQLTEKTNQFNINKHPMTEEEIIELINSPKHKVFYGRATDRFGDHGIINFAVAENKGNLWNIDDFLMSCRVIGRGIEEAFLASIGQVIKTSGAKQLSIKFVPTEKNKPAEEFVNKHFKEKIILTSKIIKSPSWIKINSIK